MAPVGERRFWASSDGSDLTEYSVLLGFLFLVCLCLFLADTGAVWNIWQSASGTLNSADSTSTSKK